MFSFLARCGLNCLVVALLALSARGEEALEKELPADAGEQWRRDYVVAARSISPDGKFALIVPVEGLFSNAGGDRRTYLIEIAPFRVLGAISDEESFRRGSLDRLLAFWRPGIGSVLLIREGIQTGPDVILVCRWAGGQVVQRFDLEARVRSILRVDFRRAGVPFYDSFYDFVLDQGSSVKFSRSDKVLIDVVGNSNPGDQLVGVRSWKARLRAEFDPASGRVLRQKIDRSRVRINWRETYVIVLLNGQVFLRMIDDASGENLMGPFYQRAPGEYRCRKELGEGVLIQNRGRWWYSWNYVSNRQAALVDARALLKK